MAKSDKFIFSIVPLTKLPLNREQAFSYRSEEGLSEGDLVSVPFSNRKIEGVVVGRVGDKPSASGKNLKLKDVDSLIEKGFVSPEQFELARFAAEYYFSPLGIMLKNFVPKRAKARKKKAVAEQEKEMPDIRLTPEQSSAVSRIAGRGKDREFLLFGPAGSGKTEVYIHSILELRKSDPETQALILLPEKTLTPQAIERYGAYFPADEIAVLSSNVSSGAFYEGWQRIRNGQARIIIGTRMAVFAPFRKLGLIVIDEEQDISYKQWDMGPRYDARTLARKLAEIHGARLVFGSATPSVAAYHQANEDLVCRVDLPELEIPGKRKPPLTIEIVDMRLERWQAGRFGKEKAFPAVSKKLKGEIAYALKNKTQVILLVNRQGMSSFSVCQKCKAVLKCPRCDRALVYDCSGRYRCLHCSYETSITPECPACGGLSFRNVGLGTQKVEKEIKDAFPGARVIRADSQELSGSVRAHEELYRKFSDHEADILVGTQIVSKGWDLPNVSLVGIIDADNLLSLPDFSASEKAFDLMFQLAGRASRPGARHPGMTVIQTYRPEGFVMRMFAARDKDGFYKHELDDRKALGYPPFGRMAKIFFQDFSSRKAEAEVSAVADELAGIEGIRVAEPQESFVPKIRGKFRRQLVIRSAGPLPEAAVDALKSLPDGWSIDIDPISSL